MREIPLTQGYVALVDDDDYERVAPYKWHSLRGYAVRKEANGRIFMHRQIIGAPVGTDVDHVNHNRSDNRKANLRLCTPQQNAWNMKKSSRYGYKGIQPEKGKWSARIRMGQRNSRRIGVFDSPEQAAYAYDLKATELFGEFACLNFPENSDKYESELLALGGTFANPHILAADRTHCPNGHRYDEANTLIETKSDGTFRTRRCRICRTEQGLKRIR